MTAATGGWYDGQQFWNGSLSNPGEFNSQNNQPGQQGTAYVAPKDEAYINQQRQQLGLSVNPTQAFQPTVATSPISSYSSNSTNMPSINQPSLTNAMTQAEDIYKSLFTGPEFDAKQSVVTQKQTDLSNMEKQFIEAKGKINDNPFLSEATRVGRVAKLESLFNERTANLRSDVATAQGAITQAKADAQVKYNIAQNVYNIQDKQYQQQLSTLNNVLTAGGFINASPQDVANASVQMGIPVSMLQSIIDKQKKDQEVKPTLSTVDDGTNQYIVAVDQNGNVINKSIIGSSKPKAATADQKLASGEFNNTHITKAINILAKADVSTNEDDKGDKLLSAEEQSQALLKIQSEIVADPDTAFELFQKAFTTGGFGGWTP